MKSGDAIYFVLNNHTFGYIFTHSPGLLGVLASKPQLGAALSMEPVPLFGWANLRIATPEDFDFFRVQMPSDAVPVAEFHVTAGKYESGEDENGLCCLYDNVKFSDVFSSFADAQKCIADRSLRTYPFCRIDYLA